MYLGTIDIGNALDSGEITMTDGDPATLSTLMSLFDPLDTEQGHN